MRKKHPTKTAQTDHTWVTQAGELIGPEWLDNFDGVQVQGQHSDGSPVHYVGQYSDVELAEPATIDAIESRLGVKILRVDELK